MFTTITRVRGDITLRNIVAKDEERDLSTIFEGDEKINDTDGVQCTTSGVFARSLPTRMVPCIQSTHCSLMLEGVMLSRADNSSRKKHDTTLFQHWVTTMHVYFLTTLTDTSHPESNLQFTPFVCFLFSGVYS